MCCKLGHVPPNIEPFCVPACSVVCRRAKGWSAHASPCKASFVQDRHSGHYATPTLAGTCAVAIPLKIRPCLCAQACFCLLQQQQGQSASSQQQQIHDAEAEQRLIAQLGSRGMSKPGPRYEGFGGGSGVSSQEMAMAAAAMQHPVGAPLGGLQQQHEQQRLIAEMVRLYPCMQIDCCLHLRS